MKLLHLLDNVGAGGPFRSLLEVVKHSAEIQHSAIALATKAYPPLLFEGRKLGLNVTRGADAAEIERQIQKADLVLIHFWNAPRLWNFLTNDPPTARYAIWSKVLGSHPPQLFSPHLLRQAAAVVVTAASPQMPEAVVIPGLADFGRLAGVTPESHDGFNVDYIGTLNIGKIHPEFADIMSRIDVPGVAVRIFGGEPEPALSDALRQTSDPSRFRVLGFVEDISSIFSTSDVFGYPLARNTYATSDKSLQEAMYAGVTPVVMSHGGPARFVADGKTGLVAPSADEFVRAVEYLYRNPEKRRELGRNAAAYARAAFAVQPHVDRLVAVLGQAEKQPPKNLMQGFAPLKAGDERQAERFLVSQGWSPGDAVDAMLGWREGGDVTIDRYVGGLAEESFRVEGGVLHWRNTFPKDAALCVWSSIWLLERGRLVEARRECEVARNLGAPDIKCRMIDELAAEGTTDRRRAELRKILWLPDGLPQST